MACLTLGDNLMRPPMAKRTRKGLVFGYSLTELFPFFLVAWSAKSPGRLKCIIYHKRLMRLMAGQTIRHFLTLDMWFMTLETFRLLTMDGMAEGTCKLRMFAWIIFKRLALLRMTGQAWLSDIFPKFEGKRLMRI